MNYKQKYLKYKIKYLTTKKLYGGMDNGDMKDGDSGDPVPMSNVARSTKWAAQPPSYARGAPRGRPRSLPEIEYKSPPPELKRRSLPQEIESKILSADLERKNIDEKRDLTFSEQEKKTQIQTSMKRLLAEKQEYIDLRRDPRANKETLESMIRGVETRILGVKNKAKEWGLDE